MTEMGKMVRTPFLPPCSLAAEQPNSVFRRVGFVRGVDQRLNLPDLGTC